MSQAERKYDLVIVGGGPAGLVGAMTAGYEGLKPLVLDDRDRLGGQIGGTPMIDNHPGFPEGISGPQLASRYTDHALRFGARFEGPTEAIAIETVDDGVLVRTEDGEEYLGENVLLSTGAQINLLKNVPNIAAYRDRGVHYEPPNLKIDHKDKRIVVVGGGNSAGQAAMELSGACDVSLLIRGSSIDKGMSRHLINQITENPRISICTNTELRGVHGDGCLRSVTLLDNTSDETSEVDADEVYIFIGAKPHTRWLPSSIELDSKNYVNTGIRLTPEAQGQFIEMTKGRHPARYETSMPHVFAAGDASSGTPNRVTHATAGGSGVVSDIFDIRLLGEGIE